MHSFQQRLQGGHPNSLGNTVEIVEEVLLQNDLFEELFNCYFSEDEVVRLRTSNAMKRICKEKKALLLPYMDRFLTEIANIDQASAQWTLSQLFGMLKNDMSPTQVEQATSLMKKNLEFHDDWIVLSQAMETLSKWSSDDQELTSWLRPQLERLSEDKRKSVAGKAKKILSKTKT